MIWVGIDWSEKAWDYHAEDEGGEELARGQVEPGLAGLAELFRTLEAHGRAHEIAVAIETKHGPAVQALLDRGYRVYPVNPKASERFREAMHLGGDKSDPIDAETLARLLAALHQTLHPLTPDAPEIVALRLACRTLPLRLLEVRPPNPPAIRGKLSLRLRLGPAILPPPTALRALPSPGPPRPGPPVGQNPPRPPTHRPTLPRSHLCQPPTPPPLERTLKTHRKLPFFTRSLT